MAIVINGSGTVTGLAVGGLPDGTVDDGTLASNAVTEAKIATDAVTAAKIPASLENTFVSGRKNMIINGGMNVWQRGTSATISDGSNENYNTVDRFKMMFGGAAGGTVTWNQSTDVPANQGFGYSLKVDCTGTFTPDAAKEVRIIHMVEGQNIQSLAYGNSSPKTATLSFWFKTNKVGLYSVYLEHSGTGTRRSRYSFTPSASATWEKITINITGDSVAIPNTSSGYFGINIMLANVPSYSSSASTVAWGTSVNLTNSSQVNFMDSTSNELYLTGVQLEVGDTATDFEHRSYGEELALCQRYFEKLGRGGGYAGDRAYNHSSRIVNLPTWATTKRADPTVTIYSGNDAVNAMSGYSSGTDNTVTSLSDPNQYSLGRFITLANSITQPHCGYFHVDAEL